MTDKEEQEEKRNGTDRDDRARRRTDEKQESNLQEQNGQGEDKIKSTDEDIKSVKEPRETEHTTAKEKIDVPQIDVVRPSSPRTQDQDENLPTGQERLVVIPQVDTSTTTFMDPAGLEENLPLADKTSQQIQIPQLDTSSVDWLDPDELDEIIAEPSSETRIISVPQMRIDNPEKVQSYEGLVVTTPTKSEKSQEERIHRRGDEQVVSEIEEDEFSNLLSEQVPDIMELLLGADGDSLLSDGPIVVYVEHDEMVSVVETLVRRIYREKVRKKTPTPLRFSTIEEVTDETRWIEAEDKIFTVKLTDEDWKELENREKHEDDWHRIWKDRMNQLYGQEFGAIVLNREPPSLDPSLLDHPPTEVRVRTEDWVPIANVFWPEFIVENETFSSLFNRRIEGECKNQWKRIRNSHGGVIRYATENDESASKDHYLLKILTVKHLTEEMWGEDNVFNEYEDIQQVDHTLLKQYIRTEAEDIIEGKKPDVVQGERAFEIEMFFSEESSSDVEEKLQTTVEKYSGTSISQVNIVIDNLTTILHLQDFVRFTRRFEGWQQEHDIAIQFQTVDLWNQELIPLSDIIPQLREITEDIH